MNEPFDKTWQRVEDVIFSCIRMIDETRAKIESYEKEILHFEDLCMQQRKELEKVKRRIKRLEHNRSK